MVSNSSRSLAVTRSTIAWMVCSSISGAIVGSLLSLARGDLFAQVPVVGVDPGCRCRQLAAGQAVVAEHLDQVPFEVVESSAGRKLVPSPRQRVIGAELS